MDRVEGFFEAKVAELQNTVKALQWDNAELTKKNGELSERVAEMAMMRNNRRPNNNRDNRNRK
jgi:FtsZ-binding cell division protein ZapB